MNKTAVLSNQQVLSILRDSPSVKEAIRTKEIKKQKKEMAKKRLELIEQRRSRLDELQDAYTEVEREIMEVKDTLP